MAMARLYTSKFAARQGATLQCEQCREPIAKGETYIWYKVGFRSRFKHVRHTYHPPKDSERESSLMAGVYSAREDGQANIDALQWTGEAAAVVGDIESELESVAGGWRDVALQYSEAAEAMGGAGERMQETADSIDYAADEITGWSPDRDEPELCEEHDNGEFSDDCDECQTNICDWLDEVKGSGRQAIDDAEGSIEQPY